MYYIKRVGYKKLSDSFIKDGIHYPSYWLKSASQEQLEAVEAVPQPLYNPSTQILDKRLKGWLVRDKTQEDYDREAAEAIEAIEKAKADKIEELWQAATDYEKQFISGSAPAEIRLLAAGGNLKAVAIAQWVKAIWADYYVRKTQVQEGVPEVDTDFSNNGEMPYTVRETIFGE